MSQGDTTLDTQELSNNEYNIIGARGGLHYHFSQTLAFQEATRCLKD